MAEYASFWKWDKDGPLVAGEIVDIRHEPDVVLRNGNTIKEHDVLEIEGPQGSVLVAMSIAALRGWMQAESPQIGDGVVIEFLGWEDIIGKDGKRLMKPDAPNEVWQRRLFRAEVKTRGGKAFMDIPPAVSGGSPSAPTWDDDDSIPF